MAPPPAATSTGESSLTEGTGTAQDELTQTIDHMDNALNQFYINARNLFHHNFYYVLNFHPCYLYRYF